MMSRIERRVKVGLIGCGAIGTVLAEAIERKLVLCDELIVYDVDVSKAMKLKSQLKFPLRIVKNLDELLALKPKVIVEAASQEAAKGYVPKIVSSGVDVIVLSTGALLDLDVDQGRVHLPSGAIGGLDALACAALAGVDEVVLTSRKKPKSNLLLSTNEINV